MKKDLTKGNVFRNIITLALPIITSSFLQFAYNFTDMIWVGKLGSDAVAAVGTSAFFLQLCWAISSVFILGTGISVSQEIGAKNNPLAEKISREAFTGIGLIVAIMLVLIQIFPEYLIGLFNLNDSIVEGFAISYLRVAAIGLFFSHAVFLFTSISNSRGDSKTPMKITMIGVVVNIILDPIFIFIFNFGVIGAAIATVISQILSFGLFYRKSVVHFFGASKFKISFDEIGRITRLGIPSSIQRIVFTVIGIIMARIVAQWGSDAIAAQKIGLQIESMTFMITGGLMGALLSFTGQNYGAKEYKRVNEGYQTAIKIAITFGILMGTLFYIFPEFFVRWFVTEEETVAIGASYLRVIGLSQVFMTVEMVTTGIINGLGKTKIPASINITMTVIRVPMALYLSQEHLFGINGVWMAIAISTVLRAICLSIAYHTVKRKMILSTSI
ncbi:MATE family efflux transporter [Flammeovirga sp. MY04]|uniref:MATE family efflux transporter n=1 Tax=Flammeovirga sp. MY04 TaxID=1191459 RepID=UPI0008062FBD|nr:MATE family efflux transporter [Flammeovirga sp. MY04]ANQ52154.1 MATE family efflux transporter [Flammeovirga sp. MY04]